MIKTERKERTVSQTDSARPLSGLCFHHLDRMLTEIGLWQHTAGSDPNPRHGYSIDDEARGLIVGLQYWQQDIEPRFHGRLAATCFQFIQTAALTVDGCAGRYHNFCDADGKWLDSVGSEDSFGRTLWGLGVAHAIDAPFAPRIDAEAMLQRSLPVVEELHYLRSKAFVILGLAHARLDDALLQRLADDIADSYEEASCDGWRWFEDHMTYCNGRLPQAMFLAAAIFPHEKRYLRIGTEALDFLLAVSRDSQGGYAPIGNAPMDRDGWFKRGQGNPPRFDQQPVDAGALVEACVTAAHTAMEPRFRQAAKNAFAWYFGHNCHGLPVYNPETGAVADALTQTGLNRNQGAESVLSFHLAYQALQTLEEEF